MTPAKDPQTRIKPLTLASGHGRCMTVTPERTLCPLENGPLHDASPLNSRWAPGAFNACFYDHGNGSLHEKPNTAPPPLSES